MCVCCVICEEREKGDGLRRNGGRGWGNRAGRAFVRIARAATQHSCGLSLGTYYAHNPRAQECHYYVWYVFGRSSGKYNYTYFRHCMTTGFSPFHFPTRVCVCGCVCVCVCVLVMNRFQYPCAKNGLLSHFTLPLKHCSHTAILRLLWGSAFDAQYTYVRFFYCFES